MPFKLHPTPSGDATGRARLLAGGGEETPKVNRTAVMKEADEDVESLQEAADEKGAPDFQPGGPPKDSSPNFEKADHLQRPVYPQTIPWPDEPQGKLPFKVSKP